MKRSSVADKVVAVTGGARGIGLATATVLHSLGAKVAIGDIDRSAVKEASNGLGLEIGRRLDVTDRRSFTDFLDTVEERLGTVDVLVNNAGVIAVGSAVDEADAVTRRLLDVNIFGVILGTKLAAQRMLPRGHGHIINIASVGSLLPVEGIATYCATKHAVLGYTDAVRMENRGERRAVLGDSADPGQYRDDCRCRAREGLQERRTRRRGPGGCQSDRQTKTACVRPPFVRQRSWRPSVLCRSASRRRRHAPWATGASSPPTSRSTSAQPMPGALGRRDSQPVRTSKSASTG